MTTVLNLQQTRAERRKDLLAERADLVEQKQRLEGTGWGDVPLVDPRRRLTAAEREALSLASGEPLPDEPVLSVTVIDKRLAVIDRALQILDARDAAETVPALQARIDNVAKDIEGRASKAIAVLLKLGPEIDALTDLATDSDLFSYEASSLRDIVARDPDASPVRLALKPDHTYLAGRFIGLKDMVEAIVKDARDAGLKV